MEVYCKTNNWLRKRVKEGSQDCIFTQVLKVETSWRGRIGQFIGFEGLAPSQWHHRRFSDTSLLILIQPRVLNQTKP